MKVVYLTAQKAKVVVLSNLSREIMQLPSAFPNLPEIADVNKLRLGSSQDVLDACLIEWEAQKSLDIHREVYSDIVDSFKAQAANAYVVPQTASEMILHCVLKWKSQGSLKVKQKAFSEFPDESFVKHLILAPIAYELGSYEKAMILATKASIGYYGGALALTKAKLCLQQEFVVGSQGKLGTFDLRDCIAIILRDSKTNQTLLAHIDTSTKSTVINELVSNFPNNIELEVRLVGAYTRSQGSQAPFQNIDKVISGLMKVASKGNFAFKIISCDLLHTPHPAAFVIDTQTGILEASAPENFDNETLGIRARQIFKSIESGVYFGNKELMSVDRVIQKLDVKNIMKSYFEGDEWSLACLKESGQSTENLLSTGDGLFWLSELSMRKGWPLLGSTKYIVKYYPNEYQNALLELVASKIPLPYSPKLTDGIITCIEEQNIPIMYRLKEFISAVIKDLRKGETLDGAVEGVAALWQAVDCDYNMECVGEVPASACEGSAVDG